MLSFRVPSLTEDPNVSCRSWDTAMPDPVPLAAGPYDVRFQEFCFDEEGGEVWRCGFATAEVDGPTVVKMPELEQCSWQP